MRKLYPILRERGSQWWPLIELIGCFKQEDFMAKGEKRIRKKNIRTKTIGFRLEPKLRFAAELAARKQRRSLSNFIEWAVEEAVKNVTLGYVTIIATIGHDT